MQSSEVSIKTRSTPASLSFKGQATEHTTVKWYIASVLCHLTYSYMRAMTRIINHRIVSYCLLLWFKTVNYKVLFFPFVGLRHVKGILLHGPPGNCAMIL